MTRGLLVIIFKNVQVGEFFSIYITRNYSLYYIYNTFPIGINSYVPYCRTTKTDDKKTWILKCLKLKDHLSIKSDFSIILVLEIMKKVKDVWALYRWGSGVPLRNASGEKFSLNEIFLSM